MRTICSCPAGIVAIGGLTITSLVSAKTSLPPLCDQAWTVICTTTGSSPLLRTVTAALRLCAVRSTRIGFTSKEPANANGEPAATTQAATSSRTAPLRLCSMESPKLFTALLFNAVARQDDVFVVIKPHGIPKSSQSLSRCRCTCRLRGLAPTERVHRYKSYGWPCSVEHLA